MAFNNIVIDVSHHNGIPSFQQAQANGVLGVIHKASNGANVGDAMYKTNRPLVKNSGLLWGAYHFGTGEDGVAQAENFLNRAQPDDDTILVLDFEENPLGSNMTLEDARDFIVHVQQATGRSPGVYGSNYLKSCLGTNVDPVLQQCWLWLAQYGPTAVVPHCWSSWTLWQYTDGTTGPTSPHSLPGIGHCDQNAYCGTPEELTQKWATGSLV